MALWEKVLVSKEFLKSDHAEKSCQECHGGNPAAAKRGDAHKGVVKDPTSMPPLGKVEKLVCAECHEEQAATGPSSLHATLSTFSVILKARTGDDPKHWEIVDTGRKNHCAGCHSSCGQCHVSRPKFAKSGFINGHLFQKRPDMINQCTACHGSRVGDEYMGSRGLGDAHLSEKAMDCVACHSGAEMHASGVGLSSRYQLKEMPKCTGCHGTELEKVSQHKDHQGKVQCQVCHSQDYVNCFSCHTGKDDAGVAYFQNQRETEDFKIGLNYPGTGLEEKYVLVRHEPTDREVFDFYGKDVFKSFDTLPTWKRASPHNIQKRTWRNASCNHCHGNRDAFLAAGDLLDYEIGANKAVVVPDDMIPAKRSDDAFVAPVPKLDEKMFVTAAALHELIEKKAPVIVVDARTKDACRAGHVPGAVSINVMAELRNPPGNTWQAMTVKSPQDLAALFGSRGIDTGVRAVVYDNGGLEAPFLAFALRQLGHRDVAVLQGGVEGWEEAGYHLETGDPKPIPGRTFKASPDASLLLINRDVAAALKDPKTILLDVRSIAQYAGLAKHPLAMKPGRIEKAVNLPVRGLWEPEGFRKDGVELTWLLESRGVTKDRKIITTCNTGQDAAAAWYVLKYLGYPDVVMHSGSWVSWERSPMNKK